MLTDELIQRNTSFWLGTQRYNLLELETFYYGQQSPSDNGMFTAKQREQEDVRRFFKPINYAAIVVNEPVGYLAAGKVKIDAENDELSSWATKYFERRIRPRMDDIVRWQGLYGESYIYLWTDREGSSRGLKTSVIAPIEQGQRRVLADYGTQDEEELTAAVIHKLVPVDSSGGFDEYRITVSAEEIVVEKRKLEHGRTTGANYNRFELISRDANTAGVLPVIPVFNPTPSDILDFLNIQRDLDKLRLDLRASREYAGFPLLSTDAIIDGQPSVGAGTVLSGGNWTRLDPPNIQSMLDERVLLLSDGAIVCSSLALANLTGNAGMSGVAIRFLQQNFEAKMLSKAQRIASAVELALHAAARILSVDPEMYGYETQEGQPSAGALADAQFSVTLEPNIPADEASNAAIANVLYNQLGASQQTALAKAGIEDPQAEIELAQSELPQRLETVPGQLDPDDDR